jgi:hypothetical protein
LKERGDEVVKLKSTLIQKWQKLRSKNVERLGTKFQAVMFENEAY